MRTQSWCLLWSHDRKHRISDAHPQRARQETPTTITNTSVSICTAAVAKGVTRGDVETSLSLSRQAWKPNYNISSSPPSISSLSPGQEKLKLQHRSGKVCAMQAEMALHILAPLSCCPSHLPSTRPQGLCTPTARGKVLTAGECA